MSETPASDYAVEPDPLTLGGVELRYLHEEYAALVNRVQRFSYALKMQNVDPADSRTALLITMNEAHILYEQAETDRLDRLRIFIFRPLDVHAALAEPSLWPSPAASR